jgi:predicted SprT family Zn-dependent metalloprotease
MDLRKAEQLAKSLMAQYGLTDWTFAWKKGVTYVGQCCYRTKQIKLSVAITKANEEHHIIDTIKHEIAHALVGRFIKHGFVWKEKAVEIGCTPSPTADSSLIVPWKYLGTCPKCKDDWHRMRIMKGSRCPKCLETIKWSFNNKI